MGNLSLLTFVDVTESTANTTYILNAVQRKWGAQYIIVTYDDLQIEDRSGTQGNCNYKLKAIVVYCGDGPDCYMNYVLKHDNNYMYMVTKIIPKGLCNRCLYNMEILLDL